MSVSDIDLMKAWKQVLTLSKLQAGQTAVSYTHLTLPTIYSV